jgi:hypothetical protein
MANLLFATMESDACRLENPSMNQPSRRLVLDDAILASTLGHHLGTDDRQHVGNEAPARP